jgi:hypothetical protein
MFSEISAGEIHPQFYKNSKSNQKAGMKQVASTEMSSNFHQNTRHCIFKVAAVTTSDATLPK